MVLEILAGIGIGIVNGVGIAVLGYAKSVKDGVQEKFEARKLAKTCFVGAVVGGSAGGAGANYAVAQTWFASTGAIVVVEWAWNVIARRFLGK